MDVSRQDLIHYLEFLSDLGIESISLPERRVPAKVEEIMKVEKTAIVKDLFNQAGPADPDLRTVREDLGECTRCKLHSTRKTIVFGHGNLHAKVMFVGEAPGADEDAQGLPFVGRAGQLLTKILESVGFTREEVYITNILKCRPPGNRNPEPEEIASCQEFLFRQIAVVRPLVICALGTFAVQTLLKTKAPISALRGKLMEYRGTKLIATFHPAYLLRNPNEKRKVWDDMKMLRAYYDQVVRETR